MPHTAFAKHFLQIEVALMSAHKPFLWAPLDFCYFGKNKFGTDFHPIVATTSVKQAHNDNPTQ